MTSDTGEYVKDPLFTRLRRAAEEEPHIFWPLAIGLVAGVTMMLYSGYFVIFGDMAI